MSSDDKSFVWFIGILIASLTILGALDSWSDIERARHGCVEKKK